MKITILAPSLVGGGAERIMINLAGGLAARGHQVDLVLMHAVGPYLEEVPQDVRLVDLRARRASRSILPLVRYLRSEQPDVLLSAHPHAATVALFARRLSRARTRVVPTIQTTFSKAAEYHRSWKEFLLRAAMKWSHRWADAIVACSQGAADDLLRTTGVPKRLVRVIYNPVVSTQMLELAREPVDHPWFAPGAPKVVISIGRFYTPKDFATAIRAFALLRNKQDCRLLILGEGDQRGELERLVQELGLTQDVSLPGFVNNPFAYLARSSLFVFSSLWEGLPTVLIEALALGVPIVATDCESGPREILRGGQYGRLVPIGDAEAMARAMEEALSEPRREVPKEAVRPFTLEAAVNEYLKVFGEITGK